MTIVLLRRFLLGASSLLVSLSARGQDAADRSTLGGAGSVLDDGPDAFGYPVAVLSSSQRRAFMVGNALFRTNWVAAPASAEGVDGLGPLFNARSCSSCHLKDGRGCPPAAVGDEVPGFDEVTGFLVRLESPTYGGQLQDRAIQGARAEGRLRIRAEPLRGRYEDGSDWELAVPRYEIVEPAYGTLGTSGPGEEGDDVDEVAVSPRVAPQLIGLGLLELVSEESVLERADADDVDGDGISGRPSWVGGEGMRKLGRFGWKASQPTVRAQTAAAFANDMGLTSSAVPHDDVTEVQREMLGELARECAPEVSDHRLDRIAFYSSTLAVPMRRDADLPDVVRGEELFLAAGCASCHVPELVTGDGGDVEGLRLQHIRPYTDLLLHDMGQGLADGLSGGAEKGEASASEWRTPPLWGIGLFEVVSGHHRYLHDGRARNLEEAILWHGGEASAAAGAFRALPAADRARLVHFLESL